MKQVLTKQISQPIRPIAIALPPKVKNRSQWLDLVMYVRSEIRLSSAACMTLVVMAKKTDATAWQTGSSDPICYMEQAALAKELGKSPARLRAHQLELERAGLIRRRLGRSGERSKREGLGITFSDGIAATEYLLELKAQKDARTAHAADLRGQRKVHKRHMLEALEWLQQRGIDVTELAADLATWPRGDALHARTIEDLEKHVSHAKAQADKALALYRSHPENNVEPSENERPLQYTTELKIASCTVIEKSGYEPESPEQGIEACELMLKLTPTKMYNAASEAMKMYLDAYMFEHGRNGQQFDQYAFERAIQMRVRELGIPARNWALAQETMGHANALMSIYVIDAKIDGPALIVNPTGYFVAMVRLWQQGKLNLKRSLYWLLNNE